MNLPTPALHRFGSATAVSAVLCLALAGCGSSSAGGSSSSGATSSAGTSGSAPGGAARFGRGVSGVITTVAGDTVTVTEAQGSTQSVHFDSSTAISTEQPGTRSAVRTGSCVAIRPSGMAGMSGQTGGAGGPNGGQSSGSASPPAGTTPGAGRMMTGPITAGQVTSEPTDACSGTTGGFGLTGTVTSVSGDTLVLRTVFGGRGRYSGGASTAPSSTPTPSASPTPRSLTVTLTSSTTYESAKAGTASDLVAGMCLAASGASAGSTTPARALVVSQSVDGVCSAGFGYGRA